LEIRNWEFVSIAEFSIFTNMNKAELKKRYQSIKSQIEKGIQEALLALGDKIQAAKEKKNVGEKV
jgi:hypothetical protein